MVFSLLDSQCGVYNPSLQQLKRYTVTKSAEDQTVLYTFFTISVTIPQTTGEMNMLIITSLSIFSRYLDIVLSNHVVQKPNVKDTYERKWPDSIVKQTPNNNKFPLNNNDYYTRTMIIL